jgi:hypothetical protein
VHFERLSGDAEVSLDGVTWQPSVDGTPNTEGVARARVRTGATSGVSLIAASLLPAGPGLTVVFRVKAENPPTNGKCTVTLGPGDSIAGGVAQLVAASPHGGELCLRAGLYELDEPALIEHVSAPIRICGTGPGTILRSRRDAALMFHYCSHVEISNLRVESGTDQRAFVGGGGGFGGLTFLACREVSVTDCELLCGDATATGRTCITVRPITDDEQHKAKQFTLSAHIARNDLEVGGWQTGILLINVREALVQANRLRMRRMQSDWEQTPTAPRPQLTRPLGDILVEGLKKTGDVWVDIASVTMLQLRFRAEPRIEALRQDFGRLVPEEWFRGGEEAALRRFASAIANDSEWAEQLSAAGRRELNKLWLSMRAVGNGIVVGGTRADAVKVIDNFVSDTVQGIRVATSHADVPGIERAGDVLIRGNTIRARVPEMYRKDRYAVFVGAADSVNVAETYATCKRTARGFVRRATPVEGVRLYGQFGPYVCVDRTSLAGFKVGVRFDAVDQLPARRMWGVSRTMSARSLQAVRDPRALLTYTEANWP